MTNDEGLRFVITLTVISYNGKPSPAPLSANFDEFGGTIGRADNNLLVLPDQERTVSRIHAQIVCRDGKFALVDRGSNPVLVNGRVLGNGREVLVGNGTELRIGGYVLKVQEGEAGPRRKSRDPFVDLFGPAKPPNGHSADATGDALAAFKTSPGTADAERTQFSTGRTGQRGASSLPPGWDLLTVDTTARRQEAAEVTASARGAAKPVDVETHWPGRPGDAANQPTSPPAAPLPKPGGAAPPAGPGTASAPLPGNVVVSWDDPDATKHTVVRAGKRAGAPAGNPPPRAVPAIALSAVESMPSRATAPAVQAASPAPSSPADMSDLLAAFVEGLAAPTVRIDALTPEFMSLVGQLLNASANGAVELLLTRAAVKREVRASSTMLLTGDNNPLKFSPTGEAALAHLLSPPSPGFMPGVPALRDAFNDLSAHQVGYAAGMRAALDDVLSRFDPGALEARLVQRSFLQSLVPGKRQARMWEAFGQYYAQIRQEATDDFQTLLGNEFLKAYEAYVQSSKENAR